MYGNSCRLCPRACGVNRNAGEIGFCRATIQPRIARAALHMWEEPCISGSCGSGAIFFVGCGLGCVFCQNYEISHFKNSGRDISEDELCLLFYDLKAQGAHNINLVTADPYIPSIAAAIRKVHSRGFDLPFIFNTSSYVSVEAIKQLDGLIDVYLPDYKFYSAAKAAKYLHAADYAARAEEAIREMFRQCGPCRFDESGMLRKGLILRHLLMPGALLEAKLILKRMYREYGDQIYFSLLDQYTPLPENLSAFPELLKRPVQREYNELLDYAVSLGIKNAFMQDGSSASKSFIPDFSGGASIIISASENPFHIGDSLYGGLQRRKSDDTMKAPKNGRCTHG